MKQENLVLLIDAGHDSYEIIKALFLTEGVDLRAQYFEFKNTFNVPDDSKREELSDMIDFSEKLHELTQQLKLRLIEAKLLPEDYRKLSISSSEITKAFGVWLVNRGLARIVKFNEFGLCNYDLGNAVLIDTTRTPPEEKIADIFG